MKKIVALLVAVMLLTTGCTGSFMLTKKVYNFHRQQEGKWTDELIFLGCVIIPVYGLATLGDAIIFNSIEFWTGKNPVEAKTGDKARKLVENGADKAVITYDSSTDTIQVSSMKPGSALVFERTDSGVIARDKSGKLLYSSVKDSQGGVSVYDGNNQLVKYFSAEEIRAEKLNM